MTTTELQPATDTTKNQSEPPSRQERSQPRERDNGNRDNGNRDQRGPKRPGPSRDEVMAAVAAAMQSDYGSAGRILAATARNAMVILPKSSLGLTMIASIADADRVMSFIERESVKGFDAVKSASRASHEQKLYEHLGAIAVLTAQGAVDYGVKDIRDQRVKAEAQKYRGSKTRVPESSENNDKE